MAGDQGTRQAESAATEPTIFGSDISGDMVAMTRNNLNKAGIMFEVPLKQIEAQEVKPPSRAAGHPADQSAVRRTDRRARRQHACRPTKWRPHSSAPSAPRSSSASPAGRCSCSPPTFGLPKLLRLKEARKTPFFNGALECRLFRFDMVAGFNRREQAKPASRSLTELAQRQLGRRCSMS